MSENNVELQVSEPIINEVDYRLSAQELMEHFDTQYELFEAGKREQFTMEFAMLGHALDFIGFVERAMNTQLDFSEESLGIVESVLDALCDMFAKEKPSDEDFTDMAKKAAGYLGVVILKNIGGNWVQSNIGMGIQINGTNAFVYNRVARRLINGREDEVISFYESLKNL